MDLTPSPSSAGGAAAWGLLPAGHLEDNPEWRHWLAVNVHAYGGMKDIAGILVEVGHPVDLERYWFSQGGVTIQANLMDLAIDYLRRGQIEHAIRALFNNYGQQLYPETRVFTEHPVVELGHGIGPFYKTPDESKSLIWLRSCLLWVDGEALHLAPAAPRAWFAAGKPFALEGMASFFGPVTYRVEGGDSEVRVRVEVPSRRPPQELVVHVRRPERERMKVVTVNGQPHRDFDPAAEAIRVRVPSGALEIRAGY